MHPARGRVGSDGLRSQRSRIQIPGQDPSRTETISLPQVVRAGEDACSVSLSWWKKSLLRWSP